MTTKKLLLIIFGIIGAIGLLITLIAGTIIGVALYAVNNSEAAEVARNFLRQNEKLKQDIGEVQDFGSFTTGNINVGNSEGTATLHMKVIGARRTVNATVHLGLTQRSQWTVTGASYVNEAGQTVELLDKYGKAHPEGRRLDEHES